MDTRAPGSLPPRDSAAATAAYVKARQKVGIVTMAVVAALLVWAVFTFTPRPDIIVHDAIFQISGCATAGATQNVTVNFRLFNRGPVDGTVRVQLLVDDQSVSWQVYSVPGHARVPGQLATTLPDCGAHQYGLGIEYEAPPAG